MTKDDDKSDSDEREPIAIWEDILDLVAEDDAETGEPTEGDLAWSASVDVSVKSRLAEMRRQLTPTDVEVKRGIEIPREIESLDREALVAQLEIERRRPDFRYAHQDLTILSDYNLRLILVLARRSRER